MVEASNPQPPEENPAPRVTAQEKERRKTPQQRAEDIAYTINHSIYCTLTDFLNPPINAATDGWLRWMIPGCGHDHSKDGGHHHHAGCTHDHSHGSYSPAAVHVHSASCGHLHHDHDHVHPHPQPQQQYTYTSYRAKPAKEMTRWEKVKDASKHAFSRDRFIQYAQGEFIGDFGAVPLTIGMQRMFPGVMDAVRKVSEPVMKPIFKWGVESDSKRWARSHAIDLDSPEYKQHVKDVYEHEMSHFPQAMVWTGFSLALNVAYQTNVDKSPMKLGQKIALKTGSVMSGILVTAGMVVGARALIPHKMHEFDRWTSKNFILPTTRVVGKVFGVDSKAVDNMVKEQEALDHGNWVKRVNSQRAEAAEHHEKHCDTHIVPARA